MVHSISHHRSRKKLKYYLLVLKYIIIKLYLNAVKSETVGSRVCRNIQIKLILGGGGGVNDDNNVKYNRKKHHFLHIPAKYLPWRALTEAAAAAMLRHLT